MPFPDLPQTELAIVEMTNAFRAEQKRPAVRPNATLSKAARDYAAFLARSGRFAHEADGRKPSDRTTAAGYKHCIVAENLALNQDSRGFEARDLARTAVEGWKTSPPHRAAMLEPNVVEIGVGIARSSDAVPKYLSVQLFGLPESAKYTLRIENRSAGPVPYRLGARTNTVSQNAAVTHTECIPATVVFDGVRSTYTARDGQTYVLTGSSAAGLSVSVTDAAAPPKQRP